MINKQIAGFGLVETLIALIIFSTTMLMIMEMAFRQIQQARQALQSNQLRMQADAKVLLTALHPENELQGSKKCKGNVD
jgi:Tfp pilus assembly protein PilV